MKINYFDYIDLERVNGLLEGFNQSTGFVTAILDLEGKVISKSGWRTICTDFHRIHQATASNCSVSDTVLANKMNENEEYHYYRCLNGLIDVAVPLVIKGEHVANLFSGQFFFEEPNFALFEQQAMKYGFDKEEYLAALQKVPVIKEERVAPIMSFLQNITQLIVGMAAEKMDQISLTEAILKSEEALRESQNLLEKNMRDLMESQRIAHLGTWRLDVETNQVVWTEELYKMYGLDPYNPPPSYLEHEQLFTPESWGKLSTSLEIAKKYGIPYELELETITKDGQRGWMWVRGEAERDLHGNIVSLWGAAQNITERKKSEGKLAYLSFHDHLTGLHNRRYFEEELKRIDYEQMLPISIIMCDVNGLKLVNDSFGHDAGDELLKRTAKTLLDSCKDADIVARIGGDEFVVVLTKTNLEQATNASKQITDFAINEMVANIQLSISCGFDAKTTTDQSISEVISNAENNMYRQKLYERSSMRSKTIDLILNTLFEKCSREAIHARRVSVISRAIGQKMNLDQNLINKLVIAGLIHDIGKIGVDEKILNKKEALTEYEMLEIHKHAEIGWRLLSSTSEFSELANFVLNHHEQWDGKGYPNGIAGDKIPLESRIISVAGAYDEMTRDRIYRNAIGKEEAVQELLRCIGTQFDPEIVDVFVNQVLPEESDFSEYEEIKSSALL